MLTKQDALGIAKRLARRRYAGWTYGNQPSLKQVDCVQFVLAVVEEALRTRLPQKVQAQILISNLSSADEKKLPELIESEDEKIKGVQHALVSIGLGKAIQPRMAQDGDIVQYWMKTSEGKWFGHAGVLENVQRTPASARLFGAHKSSGGIATSRYKLRLSGSDRKVFLVRLK